MQHVCVNGRILIESEYLLGFICSPHFQLCFLLSFQFFVNLLTFLFFLLVFGFNFLHIPIYVTITVILFERLWPKGKVLIVKMKND